MSLIDESITTSLIDEKEARLILIEDAVTSLIDEYRIMHKNEIPMTD